MFHIDCVCLQDSHKPLVDSGTFEGEFDDEFLVPTKAPPSYPGSESPGKNKQDIS